MKKFVTMLVVLMLAIMAIVPVSFASAQTTQLYVNTENGGGLNFRTAPNSNASVIRLLGQGYPLTFDGDAGNGWAKVTARINGNNVTGYVVSKYISYVDPTTKAQSVRYVDAFNVRVQPLNGASGFVNLRASASCQSASIAQMHQGEVLSVIGITNAFYLVVNAEGHTGYVVKAYVAQ